MGNWLDNTNLVKKTCKFYSPNQYSEHCKLNTKYDPKKLDTEVNFMKVLPWRYYKVKQDRTAYYAKYNVNWQKQIFVC